MNISIYKHIQEYTELGFSCVLLTIVSTKGSTPRKAGAKMAIFPNGKHLGTIGGGCVESRVRQEALDVLFENQKNKIVSCHLNGKLGTTDSDICGGTLTVLIEYIPGLVKLECKN